jgi:hypothetical protein
MVENSVEYSAGVRYFRMVHLHWQSPVGNITHVAMLLLAAKESISRHGMHVPVNNSGVKATDAQTVMQNMLVSNGTSRGAHWSNEQVAVA